MSKATDDYTLYRVSDGDEIDISDMAELVHIESVENAETGEGEIEVGYRLRQTDIGTDDLYNDR